MVVQVAHEFRQRAVALFAVAKANREETRANDEATAAKASEQRAKIAETAATNEAARAQAAETAAQKDARIAFAISSLLKAAYAQANPENKGRELKVVDALTASTAKTKAAVGVLKSLGVSGKALLVDVQLDEKFALSVRNIPGVSLLASHRVTARDVANTRTVVVTQAAMAKLEAALGERTRERAGA